MTRYQMRAAIAATLIARVIRLALILGGLFLGIAQGTEFALIAILLWAITRPPE